MKKVKLKRWVTAILFAFAMFSAIMEPMQVAAAAKKMGTPQEKEMKKGIPWQSVIFI